ncbi:adenylyl-sulfate kinase [Variovorax sp. J22R133]|uniref:adenylyl-sulfate kinase n=1 Tax=Variovorax brevis TaxID=3053503 RepID=UPI002577F458|nr:adenylyl-sulfate kinase [Variovorax sp. J22R133]MDM0114701.1 adenylyl-sulfate kinase [Variovorax sp. J22R133]
MIACGSTCLILDGDEVRQGLSQGLGFSPEDRTENICRIAEVSRLFSKQGVTVIVAVISPLQVHRSLARRIVVSPFLEVHVQASLADCERRDVKGLYARARRGELANVTGVNDPY